MTDEVLDPIVLYVGNDNESTLVLIVVEHPKMGTIHIPLAKSEAEWFRKTLDTAIATVGQLKA
jgi:hypothetical protein